MFKILMIMNALTEFITQQELIKLTKISQRLDFKDIQFPVKIGDIHKIEKTKKYYQHWCFWLPRICFTLMMASGMC